MMSLLFLSWLMSSFPSLFWLQLRLVHFLLIKVTQVLSTHVSDLNSSSCAPCDTRIITRMTIAKMTAMMMNASWSHL